MKTRTNETNNATHKVSEANNATHTPGPWALLPDPNGWTIHANGQDITAEAFDAIDANAQLISAAPELLEALKDAEFLLRKAGQLAGPMQDSFNRSAADARAAIAKATGSSED